MATTKDPALWDGHDADWWRQHLDVPAVHVYETIPSTNDVARKLAEQGAGTLTIVVADQQTAGRGRAGRSWSSSRGSSLLCSIIFLTEADARATPGAAPVRIGNAVAQAIEDTAHITARLKWPNDVMVAEQGKVAGILCEATMRQQGSAHVIAGIGVNVDDPGADFGSINATAPTPVARGALLERIVTLLRPFAQRITEPLNQAELAAIMKRDVLYGEQVEIDSRLAGRAAGIASDGSLQLETREGTRNIYSATVRLADTKAYPGARA